MKEWMLDCIQKVWKQHFMRQRACLLTNKETAAVAVTREKTATTTNEHGRKHFGKGFETIW